MSLVMEHLLEKVYEPNEVPYFADGQVPIAVVRRLIEQAEQATEQRIIKLLEENASNACYCQDCWDESAGGQYPIHGFTNAIALIKGREINE